jgi:hypothetical protein
MPFPSWLKGMRLTGLLFFIVLGLLFLLSYAITGNTVYTFFAVLDLLVGAGLLIPVEHKLYLAVTVLLGVVVLVYIAIIAGLMSVLVFAVVLFIAILFTFISIKTGVSKTKTGKIPAYIVGIAVYAATSGLLTYAEYVLANNWISRDLF